jgi:hypothetical protein
MHEGNDKVVEDGDGEKAYHVDEAVASKSVSDN